MDNYYYCDDCGYVYDECMCHAFPEEDDEWDDEELSLDIWP